ncbi:hypothetical protein DK880_00924 [Candidatus Cardinium hertigii]|uniref:Uncharacterized protein n=1 Tax=Candidatus Cardinium hertigii TaxID=247481 RepID=A0A2Z3LDQ9_9BACT|nr:hypothetical protein DK880_00860 [Candidatus Cardinium hertigii]AWN82222.1 hypothetical protein DK880_00924 [Candidatus Cardinium hertigii]
MHQIKRMLNKNRKKGIAPLLLLAATMLAVDCNKLLPHTD